MSHTNLPNYLASIGVLNTAQAQAAQAENTYTYGRELGLSETDVSETVTAWVDYFNTTPFPLDWTAVRRALLRRAMGLGWEP